MIHPSGMFWCPRGSGRRPESVYEVPDYFFFFQIRQAVQGGLAQARFCCWACWARFFLGKKLYYISYNTFTCIPVVFVSRGLGMGGWNSKSLDHTPNWETHISTLAY